MKKRGFLLSLIFIIFLSLLGFAFSFALDKNLNGWKLTEKDSFKPDNLYDHIDGDADNFLSYGFRALDVFYYKKQSRELVIEIYNMGGPLNAFGIFRVRMGREGCSRKYGLESVASENEIVFVKGVYYVKMYVYDVWKGVEYEMDSIAKRIDYRINTPSVYPREFKVFPEEGLIPCSFAYYPENYMNLRGFNRVFEAFYNEKGKEIRVFYTKGVYPVSLEDAGSFMGKKLKKAVLPGGKVLFFVMKGDLLWGSDSTEGIALVIKALSRD